MEKRAFVEHIINKYAGLRGSNVALDVGSGTGEYTRKLIPKFKYVFSFEPEYSNYNQLIEKTPKDKAFLLNVAIGVIDGKMKLYVSPFNNAHTLNENLVNNKVRQLDISKFKMVDSITLDTVAKIAKFNIDFIRCNVAGGEDFIFKFGTDVLNFHNPDIILETHTLVNLKEVSKLFHAYDYEIYDVNLHKVEHMSEADSAYFITKRGL